MASGPEAESSPHDETFAELVRRIQIGDRTAIHAFNSMFLPGIEFLLRRKLEKSRIAAEAARVLAAAVQEIEKASPAHAVNLSGLITQTIHRLCPSAGRNVESPTQDTMMEHIADSILAKSTPLERDILRRYYVQGESPDQIRSRLRVSLRDIEETIASVRADFRRKAQRGGSA